MTTNFIPEKYFVVSVIDPRHPSLRDRLMLTIDGLDRRGADHTKVYWKIPWVGQEVLVHGYIDDAAVVARVPWLRLRQLVHPDYLTTLTPGSSANYDAFRSYCYRFRAALTNGWRYTAAQDAVHLAMGIFEIRLKDAPPRNEEELASLRTEIEDLAVACYFWPHRPRPGTQEVLKGRPGLREYQIPQLVRDHRRYIEIQNAIQ